MKPITIKFKDQAYLFDEKSGLKEIQYPKIGLTKSPSTSFISYANITAGLHLPLQSMETSSTISSGISSNISSTSTSSISSTSSTSSSTSSISSISSSISSTSSTSSTSSPLILSGVSTPQTPSSSSSTPLSNASISPPNNPSLTSPASPNLPTKLYMPPAALGQNFTSPISPGSLLNSNWPITHNHHKKNYLYCLNCNKKGHNYKNCHFPTNSYGEFHFKRCPDGKTRYLAIQKKFSPAYIELIRAKYAPPYEGSIINYDYLNLLIKDLSLLERDLIQSYDFDYLKSHLWTWVGTEHQTKCLSQEAEHGRRMFNLLKLGHNNLKQERVSFDTLFEANPTEIMEPPWEFVKGHRMENESDQQCAIRESREESTLDIYDYRMLLHVKPFQEKFTGINKVRYCNSYYLCEVTNPNKLIYYDPDHLEQNREIRKIGWFTEPELQALINPNHKHRSKMLTEIDALIKTLTKTSPPPGFPNTK